MEEKMSRLKTSLALLALMPFVTNCEFADHLAVKFGLSTVSPEKEAQLAAMQIPVNAFERPTAAAAAVEENEYGSCEPIAGSELVSSLKNASVYVEKITISRRDSDISHTVSVKRNMDLLNLANEVSDLLTRAEVPVGEYNDLDVITKNAKVVTTKGKHPLTIQGNRIKIALSRDISIDSVDASKKILVSFCTERNFSVILPRGQLPKYVFHNNIEKTVNLSM